MTQMSVQMPTAITLSRRWLLTQSTTLLWCWPWPPPMKLASIAPTKPLMQSLRNSVAQAQSSSQASSGTRFSSPRAALAMRRVGRLGLARLVGVEEGEDRALLPGEAARQPIGLRHHARDLRVGRRRREVAGADRAKAVDLVDDHQAHGPPGERRRAAA